MRCLNPFPIPDEPDPDLQSVVSLWNELRRAENGMPFGDDLRFSDLPKLSARPFVLSVFTLPERFRFEFLDEGLQETAALAGRFIDEISIDTSFSYLRAQSSATLEAGEPTFLRITEDSGRSFGRLLLPMWGNGQINTLLGAVNISR
ncbi:MAG TPA: hypothetical protein VKR55_02985 [Bradyrhizobium sp.]|uniref:hypothetical protein n=1 Tax=Bradyrhizobium sp. TaxID=376 RepID=UPI002CEB0AB7|nr:hypothetical protein [Bradyrhizobium sp.]HLZ01097.1 hypothetical protein [Bradyrhizobium sp.]